MKRHFMKKSNLLLIVLICVFISSGLLMAADNISPYGICAHISRQSEYDLTGRQLEIMNDAGIDWVRTDFDWSGVQRKDGSWDFSKLDATVAKAERAGVKILPILDYDVPWASPAFKHLDEWLEYVRRTVTRYKDNMRYWEVWNEPDGAGFWYNKPNPAEYAILLKATYDEIKKIDPDLTVLISGFSGIPYSYIEGVYKAGAADYFDIMVVHPYRYPKYPENASLEEDLDKLRELMAKYGDDGKPVWITEIGWPTHKNRTETLAGIVRCGLEYLHPEKTSWNLAVFAEPDYPSKVMLSKSDLKGMLPGTGQVSYLDIEHLKSISPDEYHVFMLPHDESIPLGLFDSIERYVKEGGIVVFSQGVPLYYTASKNAEGRWETSNTDNSYKDRLHIGWKAWWFEQGVPERAKKLYTADQFSKKLKLPGDIPSVGRFFTGSRLKDGDKFVPIVQASEGEFTGTVAAVIDLDSDLKGGVILSSIDVNAKGVSEADQAEILPRTYMISMRSGVDSIFWYNLRAHENNPYYNEDNFGIIHNDLSAKPAYKTFKVLSTMVPAEAEAIENDWHTGNIYYPGWVRPDGKKVFSLWSTVEQDGIRFKVKGKVTEAYDLFGNRIEIDQDRFKLSTAPIYLIGQNIDISVVN